MTVDGAQNQQNTSNNTNEKLNCWNIYELFTHSVRNAIKIHTNTKFELVFNKKKQSDPKKQPLIICLQETLLTKKSHRCRLAGYTAIEQKSDLTCGGNGLLIGVKENIGLNISEFQSNPHWISCKITAVLIDNTRLDIVLINVHIPSAGIRKKRRFKPKILIVGDFNTDIAKTIKYMRKIGADVEQAIVSKLSGSRKKDLEIDRMIDHISYSRFNTRPSNLNHNRFSILAQMNNTADELCIQTEAAVNNIVSDLKLNKISQKLINLYSDLKKKTIKAIKNDAKKQYLINLKKTSEELINNKPKQFWAWIKSRIGGGYTSTSNRPVLNTDGVLVIEQDQKLITWAKHFESLAKDATGNSQSNTKWQKIWKSTKNAFPECNYIITWNEIKTALKATSNNKATGTDGIPSKIWKLAERDQNYKSHLELIILKIFTVIYKNGEIQEKLTTRIVVPVSKKVNLTGYPLSPMLFYMYINDIFNGVYGVHVSGFSKWIPGLLFADDAVVIAELSDKLQIAILKVVQSALIPIGTYGGEFFGMSKFRIKPIHIIADRALRVIAGANRATAMSRLPDLIRNSYKSRSKTWVSGLTVIGKIRTGTYWSTEQLAKSQLIPKLYKEKCPCCNANVPETIEHILLGCSRWAAIRAETISKFIPRLYKLAMNNNNQTLMQAKMQLVGKLLRGESKKSLLQLRKEKESNVPSSMELETAKFIDGIRVARALILNGIKCLPTPLNRCPVARTRAFGKWTSLRTWISDLIKCPYKHRCDTWVSGCTRWAKKYNGNINKIKNTSETLNNRQKKNDKSQISKWIADTEAGTSCNWMGLELVYPELKTHINYVFKIRNGTYWTARRYAKSGFIEKRFIEECPFCRNIAPETIEHIHFKCSRWQALQVDILAQYINIYRAQVATKPPILFASISMRLVGKLLGEELKLSSTRIHKDPTVLCVKTTLATAKFLNAITLPRYLMLNSIRSVLVYPNQFFPVTETLVSQT
ncbi:hypothetical protein BB561_003249 [Smittium simulii]|uniref:Reverse transcriptase domain-containing protein n=1 Tax=Smittium simulii TaxID=133385 RepID=A0A2T9YMC9_9FUNG|nr:hypothetical protein BB561_003249 [Smittium simulii]